MSRYVLLRVDLQAFMPDARLLGEFGTMEEAKKERARRGGAHMIGDPRTGSTMFLVLRRDGDMLWHLDGRRFTPPTPHLHARPTLAAPGALHLRRPALSVALDGEEDG